MSKNWIDRDDYFKHSLVAEFYFMTILISALSLKQVLTQVCIAFSLNIVINKR